jgi:hypothetical protein
MVSLLVSTAVDRGFVPRLGQTKDYKISMGCFWLARNRDNVSEWRDMSIRGLFFQWANTINIPINKRGGLAIVQSSSHWKLTCSRHDIAERKIAELALKQQSLTNSMHSYVKVLHCDWKLSNKSIQMFVQYTIYEQKPIVTCVEQYKVHYNTCQGCTRYGKVDLFLSKISLDTIFCFNVQTDPAKNVWTRAYLIPVYQAGWSGRQMFRTAKIA